MLPHLRGAGGSMRGERSAMRFLAALFLSKREVGGRVFGQMSLEEQFSGWTGPSSDSEQEKQERTERMIRAAIDEHAAFQGCVRSVYAKGSYANNTNVKADSDVDIAVEVTEAWYWEESDPGVAPAVTRYEGPWTPSKLRVELAAALKAKFPNQVDDSGTTAIKIKKGTARVEADVVPCFTFASYFVGASRMGTKIFKKDGTAVVNYPAQQLERGKAKNVDTKLAFKKGARLLKRVENAMAESGAFRALPSYFMECLAYNCPNSTFEKPTWTDVLRAMLGHIYHGLEGAEPTQHEQRWLEVNECFYLFHSDQKWSRSDGREFAQAAWNYFRFSS
jgi:hypothetical protein